jgi:hypothetical protein
MKKITNKPKKVTKKELARKERILNKKRLKEWSIAVRNNDQNKCVICAVTKYVHAHHLIPKEIKEFKFETWNGVALCAKHHKYGITISAHKNPIAFLEWFNKEYPDRYKKVKEELNVYLVKQLLK